MALAASFAAAAPASAAVAPGDYVAIGDSYASGVGDLTTPYLPESGACKRSPNSYPRTFAKNHPTLTLQDVTCSGATVADVRANQLGALSGKTTLVTITVGGNDVGFESMANNCLLGTDQACQDATNLGAYYARTKLTEDLTALYTDVRQRAPKAQIYVLGYPRLVAQGTGSCGAVTLNDFRRQQMLHANDHLVAGIKDAVDRTGVNFVEMRLPFEGHEACGPDSWINGVDPSHVSEIFHPTNTGHRAFAFMLELERGIR